MKPILEVQNLHIAYEGTEIVRDVSFTLLPGEILGIVGESGCGKSTLVKGLTGIKGHRADVKSGHILFEGRDFLSLSRREKRALYGKEMGIVFQNPRFMLNPLRKIGKQFIETVKNHEQTDASSALKRSKEILRSLNFEDPDRILASYPFELSGGMSQRVGIALAVLFKPKIILADEPTSALDVSIQKQVIDELLLLREKFGTALIIITHHMGVVSKMADKVGVMYGGRLIEYGSCKKVLKDPAHPYTRALLQAVPRLSGEIPKGLDGKPPSFGSILPGCEFYERCAFREEICRSKAYRMQPLSEDHAVCCHKTGGLYESVSS